MPEGSQNRLLVALNTVVQALEPLSPDERRRVLSSALAFLGDPPLVPHQGETAPEETTTGQAELLGEETARTGGAQVSDIRSLREQKQPKTDVEMAAVVAYYVSELAPGGERKDAIGSADIDKYFRQAMHPLPGNTTMTLVNTKNAGYLDGLGGGRYRLNPVGHNLVVHGLPRAEPGTTPRKSKTPTRKKRKSANGPKPALKSASKKQK